MAQTTKQTFEVLRSIDSLKEKLSAAEKAVEDLRKQLNDAREIIAKHSEKVAVLEHKVEAQQKEIGVRGSRWFSVFMMLASAAVGAFVALALPALKTYLNH